MQQDLSEEEKQRLLNALPNSDIPPPKLILPVKRFHSCLQALDMFFKPDKPPLVKVRNENIFVAVYGFMDASWGGFGSTFDRDQKITYRMGVWGKDEESESSNWKEFQNFVESLEHEHKQSNLDGALVILAVDNATVESCIYKGNSTSPKLYELILRFKKLEMHSGARFIVSHVSGERMKNQGTDGVSRGSFREGITLSHNMLAFCPWHLTCLDQKEHLRHWVKTWAGGKAEFLTPDQWFTRGHDWNGGHYDDKGFWRQGIKKGTYVWTPPPAAAHVALEELRKSRIKRQDSVHIVLIPKLMTPLWLKQF